MENKKRLIVLIPHYNNPSALKDTLMSIQESFSVDILIVDDGSRSKPEEQDLHNSYKNGTLYFEYLPENKGIGFALNHGLKKIREWGYPWVGRLDVGDLNKKDKYKKQFDYLDKHPEIKLLGTWANMVDEKGNLEFVLKHPESHDEIKKKMYINNRFVHPTVIFNSEIFNTVGFYPEKYAKAAQDYAYFFQVMKHFQVGNLPEALLDYVLDENSISNKKRKLQVKNRINIIWDNFYFGLYPIMGLIRNPFLLILSRDTITFFKKFLYKK